MRISSTSAKLCELSEEEVHNGLQSDLWRHKESKYQTVKDIQTASPKRTERRAER